MIFYKTIEKDCYVTNPNNICASSCYILTNAIFMALNNTSKEDIITNILDPEHESNKDIDIDKISLSFVKKGINGETIDIAQRNKGWVLFALYITFYVFKHFNDYPSSIKYIIEQKGDTDTNACIAGYLLGAYYGLENIKSNNKMSKNIDIILNCTTRGATKRRPNKYLMHNYYNDDNINKIMKFISIAKNINNNKQ